jgi:tetratricopeptide (TPR) repeat protein
LTRIALDRRRIAVAVLLLCGVLAAAPAHSQDGGELPPGVSPDALQAALTGEAPPSEPAAPAAKAVPAFGSDTLEPALVAAWSQPSASLQQRVDRTRRASLEAGTWSFDPAARAVLRGDYGGNPIERAEAAVALAPQLPLAHMQLAEALWLHAEEPMKALRAALGAFQAIRFHPEASAWFAGTGLFVLAAGLTAGTLLLLALMGLRCVGHAAHDLGHLTPGDPPSFARFALLGGALLLPIIAGEGGFGFAVGVLLICVAYGGARQRLVLFLSAGLLWAALFPMARIGASALEVFPRDSVARGAYSLTLGLSSPGDVARLEAAMETDTLALRALAMEARRSGSFGRADALYQQLLERGAADVSALNNAANVRLALGHLESAIDLYGRALDIEESPVVLFNLSQAYVKGFHVDELNRALAAAQRVNGELIAELTALQRLENTSLVIDMPIDANLLWERVLASDSGEALAASLRAPLLPGRLGRSALASGMALAAACVLGLMLGGRGRSHGCTRCGSRICGKCGLDSVGGVCDSCDCLFNRPEKTDRALRFARIEALRKRDKRVARVTTALSLLVPGAAGILNGRPFLAFLGALGFALAAAGAWWRAGIVPDPLVAGSAAPALFGGIAALALLVYVATIITALAQREADK